MKLVYKNNIISDTVGNMDGATSQSAGTAGLVPAPLSTDRDKYLKGDGTWSTVVNDVMEGATSSADGSSGLVPQPLIADRDKYLKGDGTWASISSSASGIRYNSTASGLHADNTQDAIDEVVSSLDSKADAPIVKNVTLEAGETEVTFTQMPTTGNNLITFFTSTGINYTSIDASVSGEVTLTFDVQEDDVVVSCEIKEV